MGGGHGFVPQPLDDGGQPLRALRVVVTVQILVRVLGRQQGLDRFGPLRMAGIPARRLMPEHGLVVDDQNVFSHEMYYSTQSRFAAQLAAIISRISATDSAGTAAVSPCSRSS